MSLNIKRVIKAHGLEVREVAQRMGITPTGLSQHINGNPSVEVLERIAAAIGVEVWELFKDRSEVIEEAGTNATITCPKCGQRYAVEIKYKEG